MKNSANKTEQLLNNFDKHLAAILKYDLKVFKSQKPSPVRYLGIAE